VSETAEFNVLHELKVTSASTVCLQIKTVNFVLLVCLLMKTVNTVHCNIATSSDRTFRNNNIQLSETLYTYSVGQKSSPCPKTFCNIFTQVKCISVKFCRYVASLHLHTGTNFGRFILIFNKMASFFLGVPIVF